mgnify:FL=1
MLKIIICIVAILFSNGLFAAHYDKLYVFGDSLSDAGYQNKNPNIPINKQATFTNTIPGQAASVWPQYLSQLLNMKMIIANDHNPMIKGQYTDGTLHGTDYAAGGATTAELGIGKMGLYSPPSVSLQIKRYLDQHGGHADPAALYIVEGGANNLLAYFETLHSDPKAYYFMMQVASYDVSSSIKRLHLAGAKHIMFMGLFNILAAPIAKLPVDEKVKQQLPEIIHHFNHAILKQLASGSIHVTVVYINLYHLYNKVINDTNDLGYTIVDHKIFKFTNVRDPACGLIPKSALVCQIPTDREQYMFTDLFHPTSYMHDLIANYVYSLIQNRHP